MTLSAWSEAAGREIAAHLARLLGVPASPRAWLAFAVQARRECADGDAFRSPGARFHNPLNLTTARGTIVWPEQSGTYGGGSADEWHDDFAAFPSLALGARACAQNYMAGSYAGVRRAVVQGDDPVALARAIEASPWSSDHYGDTLHAEVAAELGELAPAPVAVGGRPGNLPGYLAIEDQVKATIRAVILAEPQLVTAAIAQDYGPKLEAELAERFAVAAKLAQ